MNYISTFKLLSKMTLMKLVFFLCLTWCFTYARVPQFHPELKDAKSDALALLEQLERNLQQARAMALYQVAGFIQLLDNTGTAVLSDAKESLEAEIIPFLADIEELQAEATEAGVDITGCIGNITDIINALPAQFFGKISSCVEAKVAVSKRYVNQTIEDIDSTFDVVTELGDQINVCANESSVQQVQCFMDITANITESTSTLPLQIIYDGAEIQTFVYAAIPEIAMCSVGMIDDIDERCDAIVDIVTTCVLHIINGTIIESFYAN